MEFYYLKGMIRTFNSKPKSEIGLGSLTKLFKQVLKKINVPFVDPCCVPDGDVMATVRYNVTDATLEYLSNAETDTWTPIV